MGRPRKSGKHLPPRVYEKHGAYYFVQDNKWIHLGKDLPAALEEYGRRIDTPKGGMNSLVDRVLDHIRPRLAKNTQAQYKIAAGRIKEAMGEFAPHQVKPKHVAALKLDMADTPNMANRILSVLRMVFAHAVEWQEVESNPCIGIMRHAEAKRERYITDEEYRRIYAKAPERLQVMMDLLYLTGQRVGDVIAIKRADITDEGIRFAQQKTGAKLLVRWTPDLKAVIDRAYSLQGNVLRAYLFRSRAKGGKPPVYEAVRDQWRLAVKESGVQDANIHDLRAKSLTDAKRQGKDATALAGHATATMTDRYIRLRETPTVDGPAFARPAEKIA